MEHLTDTSHKKITSPKSDGDVEVEVDDYDTIATLPTRALLTPTQPLTQPTQLVDFPLPNPSHIVQVAASSPPAPSNSPPRRGGLLSSLLAPSGTQFRSPATTSMFPSEGPTYRGGSSDDEFQSIRNVDIQKSTFEKMKSPEKIAESPVRTESSAMDAFKKITAAAVYDPSFSGFKRSADHLSPIAASSNAKKAKQGPYRQFSSLEAIEDTRVRIQTERIQKVMPTKSISEIAHAVMIAKGNYDNALDYLAGPDEPNNIISINSSDDELTMSTASMPIAKQQKIKALGSIRAKWAAKATAITTVSQDHRPSEEVKPRGRLIRGARSRAAIVIDDDEDDIPTKSKPINVPSPRSESSEAPMSDSEDSDVQYQGSTAGGLDQKVLKFFNTCNVLDLVDTATIPEESASVIIAQRPFFSLDEVRAVRAPVDESKTAKGKKPRKAPKPIGDKIVDKCIDMWTGYLAIDSLVAQCEAMGKPVAQAMEKWGVNVFGKPDGDFELASLGGSGSHDSGIATPSSNRQSLDDSDSDHDGPVTGSRKQNTQSRFIGQPAIMSNDLVMKDYQIVGLNWLSLLFENDMSCILADDMGLGKTCQVISFLAHLYEKDVKGPHLVVVPASTIENWLREFEKFCPALTVIPYYGTQNERLEIQEDFRQSRENVDVVITTYATCRGKYDHKFLRSVGFCACVYDEGHVLKNANSQVYEKLIRIPAKFRLLLTGTPLQNNLQELASLLGFILPKVFNEHKEDLNAIFANKAKTTDETSTLLSAQRVDRAKSMLKPFVLRRKKHQVIDLPAKISRVQYCKMSESQLSIYNHAKEGVRQLLSDRAAGIKTGNKSANIMMRLRQASIHPLLARKIYNEELTAKIAKACLKIETMTDSIPAIIVEDMLPYNDFDVHAMCVKYKPLNKFALKNQEWMDSGKVEMLAELLKKFVANGDRTLIFSQFTMLMDILEVVLDTLDMKYVRLDGKTNVQDRQAIMDHFHEQVDIPVFLLSTKAGGAGINLACANKVIIFDSSFNPQEDVQAENRAHRVGQTREVEVIRFVSSDTIDEQIHKLGQTKLALDQAVAGEDEASSKKSDDAGFKAVESMIFAEIEKEVTH
ncbi:hypothetical protein N7495_009414 [Penicillium taxi]|uniref:uncharacterized protein n=1 Tax=Penicillium taxi TaxID=168475 RepID=UPI0025456F79|nr:uncharacterized protein N7495_009414 [Penicillium taxi]KAJ5884904.1 hypothetical protein N7495_009414 [Penicillium taxi]